MYFAKNERQLLADIRRGKRRAFDYLVTTTQAALVGYCARLVRPRALAEDVVQDVFTALWVGRRSWHVHGSLMRYLRRAVRNRSIDVAKQRRRQEHALADMPSFKQTIAPEQRVICRDFEEAVLSVLRTLPLRCRQVFILCALADYTQAEAATTLGLARSTVTSYLGTARHGILQRLQEGGYDLPDWVLKSDITRSISRRSGGTARSGHVDVTLQTDMKRHDPAQPFATTDIRVRRHKR